jgi:hypothetical protein
MHVGLVISSIRRPQIRLLKCGKKILTVYSIVAILHETFRIQSMDIEGIDDAPT